jgi:hypothetical protein
MKAVCINTRIIHEMFPKKYFTLLEIYDVDMSGIYYAKVFDNLCKDENFTNLIPVYIVKHIFRQSFTVIECDPGYLAMPYSLSVMETKDKKSKHKVHIFYRGVPLCNHIQRHLYKKYKEIKTGLSLDQAFDWIHRKKINQCNACMRIIANFMK